MARNKMQDVTIIDTIVATITLALGVLAFTYNTIFWNKFFSFIIILIGLLYFYIIMRKKRIIKYKLLGI